MAKDQMQGVIRDIAQEMGELMVKHGLTDCILVLRTESGSKEMMYGNVTGGLSAEHQLLEVLLNVSHIEDFETKHDFPKT